MILAVLAMVLVGAAAVAVIASVWYLTALFMVFVIGRKSAAAGQPLVVDWPRGYREIMDFPDKISLAARQGVTDRRLGRAAWHLSSSWRVFRIAFGLAVAAFLVLIVVSPTQ